jgi:hypothetical protein
MNENIRRLIEQAGETEVVNVVDRGDGYMETQVVKEFDREWFAELIVKECIDWLAMNEEDAKELREHFGVEE